MSLILKFSASPVISTVSDKPVFSSETPRLSESPGIATATTNCFYPSSITLPLDTSGFLKQSSSIIIPEITAKGTLYAFPPTVS